MTVTYVSFLMFAFMLCFLLGKAVATRIGYYNPNIITAAFIGLLAYIPILAVIGLIYQTAKLIIHAM